MVRSDILMEGPKVALRWEALLMKVLMEVLMEVLRVVRWVGPMEALRAVLIVVQGETEKGALLVGRNDFPVGRVEVLLSCS